jgi:hypothetical protein
VLSRRIKGDITFVISSLLAVEVSKRRFWDPLTLFRQRETCLRAKVRRRRYRSTNSALRVPAESLGPSAGFTADNLSPDLGRDISNLSITTSKPKSAKEPGPVIADSWEDEDVSSGSDAETGTDLQPRPSEDSPSVPPPTPSSPSAAAVRSFESYSLPYGQSTLPEPTRRGDRERPERRPEKSAAVASRLIAGALGVRAPKQTQEQRAYEKAVREKERRRKEEEKERLKDEERKKAAVWED